LLEELWLKTCGGAATVCRVPARGGAALLFAWKPKFFLGQPARRRSAAAPRLARGGRPSDGTLRSRKKRRARARTRC